MLLLPNLGWNQSCQLKVGPEPLSNFDGEQYFDPRKPWDKSFWSFLKWQMSGGREDWPQSASTRIEYKPREIVDQDSIHITFINHASFLLKTKDLHILTDPIFSDRASPVQWAGPRRVQQPGIALAELPRIDVILVSHNHYDHLDFDTLKALMERDHPQLILPLGHKELLEEFAVNRFIELDWWQNFTTATNLKITLVPVQHWSARSPFDRNESLWGGFMLEFPQGATFFFAGDTGFTSWFTDIRERFPPIDLALLPIGSYEPRWFMKDQHMNPDDAVRAHQVLEASFSLGMHMETFQLTDEAFEKPRLALAAALAEQNVSPQDFIAPLHGETFCLHKNPSSKVVFFRSLDQKPPHSGSIDEATPLIPAQSGESAPCSYSAE
jgi:L-ascorbate metabolism protein UlaG (beta-lactamase superfamily)